MSYPYTCHVLLILLLVCCLCSNTNAFIDSTPPSTRKPKVKQTHFIFPGGGIFFNWQGGIISYLRDQNYDLSQVTYTGSSAGSLAATLAASGVDFSKATTVALELAAKYQVWDRPQGLQGVLGPMMKEWLEELLPPEKEGLPDDGRLSILLTPVPLLWKAEKLDAFDTRQELIDACLATIYLPFFTDGGLFKMVHNKPYIDGNFLTPGDQYLQPKAKRRNSKTIVLNWQKDPVLADKGEEDLVATLTPEAIWDLVELGRKYAQTMEEKGKFRHIPKLTDSASDNKQLG